ncbi:hypothetical protein AB0A74_23495 [Saccharothrix sp. NPDC042600]|uniref:hypothetical protein n=1 Tax=Saccharothrix TaxID=2071 RepID=UPI0033EF15A8
MFSLAEPPLFTRLRSATNVLVAGAGGGFDVYAGLPLAVALRPDSAGSDDYSPERTLTRWLDDQALSPPSTPSRAPASAR